jgi:ribosomal protein S14
MKLCNRCGRTQPYTEYVKSNSSKDGHQSYCRDCKLEQGLIRKYGLTIQSLMERFMLVSNCTIQRRGDGKGFICTYCACQFFIDPKNQCWMTKEYIDVEKTKENSDDC